MDDCDDDYGSGHPLDVGVSDYTCNRGHDQAEASCVASARIGMGCDGVATDKSKGTGSGVGKRSGEYCSGGHVKYGYSKGEDDGEDIHGER